MIVAAVASSRHSLSGTDMALLAAVVVFILLSGFLAMAETGLTRTNRVRVMALAEQRRRGAGLHIERRAMKFPSGGKSGFSPPATLRVLVADGGHRVPPM